LGVQKNLYLQVTETKEALAKSWLFRFVSPVTGQPRALGLGSFDDVSLADARDLADAKRRMIKVQNLDPLKEKEREREARAVEAAKHKTFGEVADPYLKAHEHDWKNAKHTAQWEKVFSACANRRS
jgi:Arm DNA-binding domain